MLQSPPFALGSCPGELLDASVTTVCPWILSWLSHWMLNSSTFPLGSHPGLVIGCFSHHLLPMDPVLVELLDASVTTVCPWILSWLHHWMPQSPPFVLGSCPSCIIRCFSHHHLPLDPVLVESLDASFTTFLRLDPLLVESLDASVTTFLRLDPVLVEPVDASVTTFCP